MKENGKTRDQLLEELELLRRRVGELEASNAVLQIMEHPDTR